MTIPNIAAVATINNKTATLSLTTTNATTILSNSAGSNQSFLINSLYLSNIDGSNAVDATVKLHPQASGGGTGVSVMTTVVVPADATLVAITKNDPITLEENTSLTITASAANDLEAVLSYSVLS
jgi:hypothetical protein